MAKTLDATYSDVATAFEKLERALLNVEKLPLPIVSVKCTSAYYRRTKALPTTGMKAFYTTADMVENGVAKIPTDASPLPPFLPSIKVLIALQKSTEWGDDLTVIGRLKSACYVDISRRLRMAPHSLFSVPTLDELYVVVERVVFRIRIVHHKETASHNYKAVAYGDGLVGASALKLRRTLVLKPLLALQLHALAQRCPAFSESCVYAKLWLDANYLGKMFAGLAVELIVAHAFLRDGVPRSGVAGFSRFIAMLATFDFAGRPLVVDLNRRFTTDTLSDATRSFVDRRPALPPLVILTPEDRDGTALTARSPEAIVLLRAIRFARAIHERISASALSDRPTEFELPQHDLNVYDIVVRVGRSTLPIKGKEKRHHGPAPAYLPVVDFEPVKLYVKALRQRLGDQALFFFNPRRPAAVGVALRPTNTTGEKGRRRAAVEALVAELRTLGGPLVSRVEIASRLAGELGIDHRIVTNVVDDDAKTKQSKAH